MAVSNIGIPIDLTKGIHTNTELKDDNIQLKEIFTTEINEDSVYESEGSWLSEVIDLVDKYTSLENLAITNIVSSTSTYKAYTSTSPDSITWSDFVEIQATTGKMLSVPERFIQIRIVFTGENSVKSELVNDFVASESKQFRSNDFINLDGSLGLKRDFTYKMDKDSSWTSEGNVFRKKIENTKLKRIDKLDF